MESRQGARRPVDTFLMRTSPYLPLAIGALLVLAGCGSTDVAAPSPSGSSSTVPPTTVAQTDDAFLDNMVASAVAEAEAGGLSRDEARCLAVEIHDGIGKDRLVEVGFSDDGSEGVALLDGAVKLTAPERTAIAGAFTTCMPDPFAFLLDDSPQNDPSAVECWAREMQAAGLMLEQILFAEREENQQPVGIASAAAYQACSEG
jgi:hypothetical protein